MRQKWNLCHLQCLLLHSLHQHLSVSISRLFGHKLFFARGHPYFHEKIQLQFLQNNHQLLKNDYLENDARISNHRRDIAKRSKTRNKHFLMLLVIWTRLVFSTFSGSSFFLIFVLIFFSNNSTSFSQFSIWVNLVRLVKFYDRGCRCGLQWYTLHSGRRIVWGLSGILSGIWSRVY